MTPQNLFTEIRDLKQELKTTLPPYRETLANNPLYLEAHEQVKAMQKGRKIITDEIKESFTSDFAKADELKEAIKLKTEDLATLILSGMIKGQIPEEVEDKRGNKYQPALSLIFKKL